MRLEVTGDRIFCILEPMVTTKKIAGPGGTELEIAIPEEHHERSRIGVIQQCGPEVVGYAPGDRVLLSTYAGVRIHLIGRQIDGQEIDEDRFRIIRSEEILCKFYD